MAFQQFGRCFFGSDREERSGDKPPDRLVVIGGRNLFAGFRDSADRLMVFAQQPEGLAARVFDRDSNLPSGPHRPTDLSGYFRGRLCAVVPIPNQAIAEARAHMAKSMASSGRRRNPWMVDHDNRHRTCVLAMKCRLLESRADFRRPPDGLRLSPREFPKMC